MTAPQRYRRRPQEVRAIQWTGDADRIQAFLGKGSLTGWFFEPLLFGSLGRLHDQVTGGVRSFSLGTWIVAEPDGTGFYPVSADVFARSYEPVPSTGTTYPEGDT